VIDVKDVLQNPERTLRLLCKAVGIEFNDSMLSWPPGLRDTDGIWAKHWYGEVAKTTSFQPYHPTVNDVPPRLHEIYRRCYECYERLYEHRLH
jgi:hypothetical protein